MGDSHQLSVASLPSLASSGSRIWPHCPCKCHPLSGGTSRLTWFPLPWQVDGGTPGSRDTTTTSTAQAGTTETALVTSVSGAGPRGRGSHCPLRSLCSCGSDRGQLCWGDPALLGVSLKGDKNLPCLPHANMSQRVHLLFFQDHGTKAGKGAAPTTDLRSLSPVRGDLVPPARPSWGRQPCGAGSGWD